MFAVREWGYIINELWNRFVSNDHRHGEDLMQCPYTQKAE